jgi:plasmid stabilization system protein ParE
VARAVEWAGRAKSDLRLAVEYIEVHPEAVWIMRVLHTSQDVLMALGRRTREEAEGEE